MLVMISAILPVQIIVVMIINVVVIIADYNLGFSLLSLLGSEKLLQRDHRHVGGSKGQAAAAHAPKKRPSSLSNRYGTPNLCNLNPKP